MSVLFGITEPALFGVNVRFKYPLIGGCIGGAVVYFTNLAALGFGTTVVPGIALADPAGNGYVNYVTAHVIALAVGFVMTLVLSGFQKQTAAVEGKTAEVKKAEEPAPVVLAEAADYEEGTFLAYTAGEMIAMEDVKDETFRNKVLGDGIAIQPEEGAVYAPVNAVVASVFETKHAICLVSDAGEEILIHIGVDTVNLKGEHFTVCVKDGDQVKAGQLLIKFDLKKIAEKGYDTVIPMIFTDPEHQPDMSGWELRKVRHGERL